MKTITHKIFYPSRSATFRLWHLTDWHVGAAAFDEKLFKQHVQQIADDPNAFWIGGGDYLDGICQVNDKRYKPETLAKWVLGKTDVMQAEADYAAELVRPIAHKCKGLFTGNHEWFGLTYYGRDIYWEFVKRIANYAGCEPGSLALGANGFVRLQFRRGTTDVNGGGWTLPIFCHHGFGGGRKPGGHALTLDYVMGAFAADLYLLGHRHVLQIVPKTITVPRGDSVRVKTVYGIFMPSYLNSYVKPDSDGKPVDTYPELIGLASSVTGAFPIEITPDEQQLELQVKVNCA